MTLFQDTGGDPRAQQRLLADLLALYGAVGDAARGCRPQTSGRVAATAVSLAGVAGIAPDLTDALYFAGLLHAVGAIGNRAHRAGETLPERIARMEDWDVPAQGARIAETIAELPPATADLIRWQAERWDGTGYPDQLRWHGIPRAAVVLALASAFVACDDPEESLGLVTDGAGRAYSPEMARTFTMWFHTVGGEVAAVAPPLDALAPVLADAHATLLDRIADRIDAHLGVDGRWQRVARLSEGAAAILDLAPVERNALAIAARIYGAGEVTSTPAVVERSEAAFDPLARLGIDDRAAHALAAAAMLDGIAALAPVAAIVGARAEWFDGSGKPHGLRQKAIPRAAAVLAAAIAYTGLDHKDRIDGAAGTQFDPAVVRAILETAKVRA